MTVQWFPGHMAKARRQIQEKLKLVDIVYELLDARIPYSSSNPMMNEIIKHKPKLIILNKADIADATVTQQWVNYFKQQNLLTEEGIEYLSRRHSERLSGCVVNLFLPGNGLSMKSRTDEIKRMCDDENTKYALRHAKLRSKKMKIILWPIKQDHAGLTYMIGAVVAFVQIRFPGLFIQLKAKR